MYKETQLVNNYRLDSKSIKINKLRVVLGAIFLN